MIGSKVRFEIFKRDLFTCQYCGRSTPEVELQIDHIIPQAKGGGDDVDNLITSCSECNYAKNDILLSDRTYTIDTVELHANNLKNIKSRKTQFKLFILYKKELEELEKMEVEEIASLLYEDVRASNTRYYHTIRNLIKKYGFNLVYSAMEQCVTKTFRFNEKTFLLEMEYLPIMCESLCNGNKDVSEIEAQYLIELTKKDLVTGYIKTICNPEEDMFASLVKILKCNYHPETKEDVDFDEIFTNFMYIISTTDETKECRYLALCEYVNHGKNLLKQPF